MQKSLEIEKTTKVSVEGKDIAVAQLPLPIRFEIESLDAMRKREAEAALDYEIISIAVKTKELHIQKLISNALIKAQPESGTTNE